MCTGPGVLHLTQAQHDTPRVWDKGEPWKDFEQKSDRIRYTLEGILSGCKVDCTWGGRAE